MDFTYLHEKFFATYQERYKVIMTGWRDIRQTQNTEELQNLQFQTHSLKGESGALGFTQLNELVTDLDSKIRSVLSQGFNANAIGEIDGLLNKLIAAHQQEPNPLLVHPDREKSGSPDSGDVSENFALAASSETTKSSATHIALIDDEKSVGAAMLKLLESFGFSVFFCESIHSCKAAMNDQVFSLILLDVVMPDVTELEVFEFAKNCVEKGVRVICMSGRDDLETRLMAVRAGIDDYALKPINVNILVHKIKQTCALDIVRPYKIVLLDDQKTIGEYFKNIGEQKGFELLTFDDAKDFINNLDVSIPDLFLLDINMPGISGFEVAKILRHEARFQYVPIVFLSADDSPATKLDVLSAGGEDVISKSDPPEHIFKQIESRVIRGQNARSLAIKDGLTGLLNHGQLMDSLSGFKRLAERFQTRFGIAMLDLDNFKQINDTYGHTAGDGVLVGISNLIKRLVRESDIVGRYGGEEFLIAFQDVQETTGVLKKLNEIRENFSSIGFETNQGTIHCSFSCGLALSNEGQSIGELINRADKAMYKAKRQGKNQVVVDEDC